MNKHYHFMDGVKENIYQEIKRRVPPGQAISKKELQYFYRVVRIDAIVETVLWKKQNISIEETNL